MKPRNLFIVIICLVAALSIEAICPPVTASGYETEATETQSLLNRKAPLYKVYKDGYQVKVNSHLQWFIRDMSDAYGIPESLIYGLILCESTFDPMCKTGKCYGLGQIQYYWTRTANIPRITSVKEARRRNLYDPYDNIYTIFELLMYCRDTYKLDLSTSIGQIRALYWYNTGRNPSKVTRWKYAFNVIRFGNELVCIQPIPSA